MLPQGNNVMVVTDPVSGYDVIGTHTYQEAGYQRCHHDRERSNKC